ncbi:DUF6708 domain-containing protein [Niveibacterium sp.]|uniref:DUF6708 domain-containing protein n=1 Tax=Niveibacterium sp. TaxID=2017444 RepID=UPI0035B253A6
MAWLQRTRRGWERAKHAAHNIRPLPTGPLSSWANSDQMVYAVSPAYLEIGQGGNSPMRGWGAIVFVGIVYLLVLDLTLTFESFRDTWGRYGFGGDNGLGLAELIEAIFALAISALGFLVCGVFFIANFASVTDATVRLDHKRKKVWLWTGKGPIEIDWSRLTPRVESSVATAYATVNTYRGQYAELGVDGEPLRTRGIPHVFQCGQISAAESGVLPSMEYVRRYMEGGPDAVSPPEKFLAHAVRWYAMVNLFGMADDWVRWRENRDKPGIAPAPWTRTIIFIVFFPIFFPLQFTNWLALAVAPRPKWPRELEALHQADLLTWQSEQAAANQADLLQNRAQEAVRPRRKPVIRVNGELISGGDETS